MSTPQRTSALLGVLVLMTSYMGAIDMALARPVAERQVDPWELSATEVGRFSPRATTP